MAAMGSSASGFVPNKHKYQSNELTKDFDLNWMDFHARQYDPQIGRFLAVDPLASSGGQEVLNPYTAMGNNPGMMDPDGRYFRFATPGLETAFNDLRTANNDKISSYTTELGSLDLLSANKDVQNRIKQLNALIDMHRTFNSQLDAMAGDKEVEFHLSNSATLEGDAV